MKDPYEQMMKTMEKIKEAIAADYSHLPLYRNELIVINAALEYATTEWWEKLKDKEDTKDGSTN